MDATTTPGPAESTVYHRVTLSYDVLVEVEPGEPLEAVAARAVEQEQLRTGLRYRVTAVDGRRHGASVNGHDQAIDLWNSL